MLQYKKKAKALCYIKKALTLLKDHLCPFRVYTNKKRIKIYKTLSMTFKARNVVSEDLIRM